MIPSRRSERVEPLRVLVAHNRYLEPGGEDRVFELERQMLAARGHVVRCHTVDNQAIGAMGRAELLESSVWNRNSYWSIRSLVERERIDVAHFHNTFPLLSPAALAGARDGGAAVVQSLHNYRLFCPSAQFFRSGRVCEDCAGRRVPLPAVRHACYRDSRAASLVTAAAQAFHSLRGSWMRHVDLFLTPSRFARDTCVRLGLPGGKIVVKPHFVDPDPGPGDGAGGYFLFVGRLAPEKGLETLLEAATGLGGEVALRIVGDGPLAPQVAEAARRIQGVSWLGRVGAQDVLRLVGAARCVVIPSRTYETFGMVAIEAFAKGTPVIVTGHGALAELVLEGRTGWTFEGGSAAGLVDAFRVVGRTLQTDARRVRTRARQEYLEKYTAARNYGLLIAAYRAALRLRHASEPGIAR